MIYTTYNTTTGEILGSITAPDEASLSLNTRNKGVLPGKIDGRTNYIDLSTNQAVTRPKDPSNPYTKYQFDWTAKSWTVDLLATENLIRTLRDNLLLTVDRVNPVWYAELTAEQQQQLQHYRQALLDVPQQTGFPESVTWPEKPTWL